jgi:hypothetical protein
MDSDDKIQSLLCALREAVNEKQALNQRIIKLDRDLHIQLMGLNSMINSELRILAKLDYVNLFTAPTNIENINCVKETNTAFTFLYFDYRRLKKNNYNAPITTKPKSAFRFLWRGAEATDLIVAKKDGVYFSHIYGVEMRHINGIRIVDMTLCYNNFIRLLRLNDYFEYLLPDICPL